VAEFIAEAEECLDGMGRGLNEMEEASKRGGRIDPDILNGVYRRAHSLKGLAGMFGYEMLGSLAHHLEDLLHQMRVGKLAPAPAVVDVLFHGIELARTLLHDKDAPGGAEGVQGIIEQVADLLAGQGLAAPPPAPVPAADQEASPPPLAGVPDDVPAALPLGPEVWNVLSEYEEYRLKENIRSGAYLYKIHACFELETFDTDLVALTELLKQHGEVITTLPSPEASDGSTIRFIVLVGTDAALTVLDGRSDITVELVQTGQSAVREEAPAPEAEQSAPAEPSRAVSQTVRVDIRKLDSLMNTVGELVLAKTVIQQISDRLRAETGFTGFAVDLFKATRTLERKLAELQDGVMEVRMVPIGQIYDRLHRTVRTASRELGKDSNFDTSGGETELDKLIMEQLTDPLMHIIRNAIDHGIETPDDRVDAGKPLVGRIGLAAYQQGNHVVIEVSDDGRGLDYDRILAVARERGVVDQEASLTQDQIGDLIFQPGFSTKSEVSELSGRGVGMDVVRRNIGELSGILDLVSTPGEGTTITITLPITLAIIQALIVDVCGRTYAMPLTAVLESLLIKPDDIDTIEQREVITLRDRTLPLLRLGSVFGFDEEEELIGREQLYVVVIGMAEKRLGLVVDRVFGRQDVVIKSLGTALGDVPGIAGATELGNQETILVLDVASLIVESTTGSSQPGGYAPATPGTRTSLSPSSPPA